jgi:hydroxymethylbilane synthase
MNKIIIGSRGSDLALWQANYVKSLLKNSGVEAEIKIIKTKGDEIQNIGFDKMEGKGFFTKEIEDALLNKQIDIAVHSHKDLETIPPEGLIVAAVTQRENPAELLLINKSSVDIKQKFQLKTGALVGTSSARRKSQLLSFRPDLKTADLRGNVPTRIQKLRDKKYDAILLAYAGVHRLNIDLSEFSHEVLDKKEFIPAPAQGALAIQIRESDIELKSKLQILHHSETAETINIERKILNLFDGGCKLPFGAYCEKEEEVYKVWAIKAESADKQPVRIYFESKGADRVVENVYKKLSEIKPCKVFISRNIKETDFFYRTLVHYGYSVIGKALIEFLPVEIKKIPDAEWLFFSSKHAVKYFFTQVKNYKNCKIGVIGKGTAEELRKHGRRADFIGYSTNTKLTGRQFEAAVSGETVLFPQAKGSIRTVQNVFSKSIKVINLTVYETKHHENQKVEKCDIYFFTSQSNVQAFFKNNTLPEKAKIIAMGHATGTALLNYGVARPLQPASFDDAGFVQAVFSI